MRRAALVVLAFVVAGCGGARSPSVAGVAAKTTTSSSASAGGSPGLVYARCMRAHGLPSFPDPQPGGGFEFRAGGGVDPSSPVFKAAQAICLRLLPGGGPPAPGTTTHPSAQWLAKMVAAARCMRRHGVPSFPDPTTTVPQLPTNGVISDIEGAIFLFPDSIDTQSPAFVHAATVCGFPLHDH